jgi:predicted RND superfamily exporter protein
MYRESILVKINNRKFLFFIVFLVSILSNTSTVAQNVSFSNSSEEIVINENGNTADTAPVRVSTSVSNSNVNFILWFMGTKEDLNNNNSNEAYSKKSILTSGREPNHLLLKTLLKKAINIKSC